MRELQLHVQLAVTTGVVQNYSLCRVDYWQTHVDECADTWYKRIQATETVKLYSCPETCQRACVNQNWPMGWLYTVVLWRSYQHRHDTWLPVCYFVAVEPYRLGRHQHCCCCHNIISSGSPPASMNALILFIICLLRVLHLTPLAYAGMNSRVVLHNHRWPTNEPKKPLIIFTMQHVPIAAIH